MRELGVSRIVTRDRGFHRFAFVDVVDPLRAGRFG
jgi:predicted nucleic acid-binding protein